MKGHNGYTGITLNGANIAYIQPNSDHWQAYSTSVNQGDTICFDVNNMTMTAYYIPYMI